MNQAGMRIAAALLGTLVLSAVAHAQLKPEVALRAAMETETVKGDLKGAIEQYKKIAQGRDRALAAKALLRMGGCYEKLGDTEARKAYERVVNNFADQPEAAAEARQRLTAARRSGDRTARGIAMRLLWSGPEADTTGSPSPDGRYLSYVHWETGDLALHDIVTGQNRLLTNKGTWAQSPEFADLSIISPDGKLVAYSWDDGKTRGEGRAGELRLIPINGSSRARVVYRNPEVEWLEPRAWSPDGKSIVVNFLKTDQTNQLASISVAGGAAGVIKTLHKGSLYRGRVAFSPDGRYLLYDYRGDIFIRRADGSGDEAAIVHHSISDHLLGWAPDAKRVLFASSRTGTNGLWAIAIADGKAQGSPDLIKPDIGEISALGFTANGSFFYGLARRTNDVYLATVDLASGKLLSPPKLVTQQGVGNTSSSDWSPDGRQLVYRSGRTFSILSVENGTTREIMPQLNVFGPLHWSPDGQSILTVGGKAGRPGLYTLDPKTGEATVLMPVEPGAAIRDATWSPDGKTVFFHAAQTVYARNPGSAGTREICRSPADSVLRSFVASPDGRQVACVSARSLFIVPAGGGEARELLRLKDVNDLFQFDGGLAWTQDGKQILFARSGSGSPHKFDLWRISAAGGEPQKLDLGMEDLREIRLHPDGRRITFTAGPRTNEVWVMENLLK